MAAAPRPDRVPLLGLTGAVGAGKSEAAKGAGNRSGKEQRQQQGEQRGGEQASGKLGSLLPDDPGEVAVIGSDQHDFAGCGSCRRGKHGGKIGCVANGGGGTSRA